MVHQSDWCRLEWNSLSLNEVVSVIVFDSNSQKSEFICAKFIVTVEHHFPRVFKIHFKYLRVLDANCIVSHLEGRMERLEIRKLIDLMITFAQSWPKLLGYQSMRQYSAPIRISRSDVLC